MHKLYCIRMRNFYSLKDIVKETKRQAIDWEEISQYIYLDKWPFKSNNPLNTRQNIWTDTLQKKTQDYPIGILKDAPSHERSAS